MTDVKLVKDCGLYPSYKKIIDFTGTKSQIITKQLNWISQFDSRDFINVNYNKFQNRLVLPIDYEEALTYTYCVLTDITGTSNYPQFFFVNDVENLTNGLEVQPSVAITISLDPIMTYMGDWKIDECMVDRQHVDRWSSEDSKPIRITPNLENATAFAYFDKESIMKQQLNNKDIVVICVAFTSDKMDYRDDADPYDNVYYAIFPTNLNSNSGNVYSIFGYGEANNGRWTEGSAYVCRLPTIKEVIDGTYLNGYNITPEDIISISILPVNVWGLTEINVPSTISIEFGDYGTHTVNVNNPDNYTGKLIYMGSISYYMKDRLPIINYDWYKYNIRVITSESISNIRDGSSSAMIQICLATELIDSNISFNLPVDIPVKPTDNSPTNTIYEPALYFAPYRQRYIADGKGQNYLEINDKQFFDNENNGILKISMKQMLDASNNSMLYYLDDIVESGILGSSVIIPNETLYVVNDAWKTYALTKKDSDRQMVTNYSIKNAIDNLIYMSYGGALIGSRSAGEEGYIGRTPIERNYVRTHDPKTGRFTGGHYEESGGKPYLTATGRRVVGAVGLAGTASIVTSLVDAHIAWANQLEKEKQIQNQPAGLLQSGTGQSLLVDTMPYIRLVETKVDNIAYQRAYENFRKYGYWTYKFEKPNIQSRKYFNYILTNGAIINGAINQSIRDVIASIFDAGVTIFHYDSGDSATRNLEYTDKENIEMSLVNPTPTPTPDTRYYTVSNVQANHTINAEFELDE